MIVSAYHQDRFRRPRYGAFGGEWEDYCANTYGADPDQLARCNSKPFPCVAGVCPPFMAPWTIAGKAARALAEPPPGSPLPPESPPSGEGILGLSKNTLLVGGGLLAASLILPRFLKRRR